jgi:hypothetical protein
MSHYLKSNEGFDHRFRLKDIDPSTGMNKEVILKGRVWYPKNITIVSDEEFEELKGFEQITQLMKRMVIQDIPELPNNYFDAMELAQKNAQILHQTKNELNKKDEVISEKDKEIEELKKKMKDAGVPIE